MSNSKWSAFFSFQLVFVRSMQILNKWLSLQAEEERAAEEARREIKRTETRQAASAFLGATVSVVTGVCLKSAFTNVSR